MIMKEFKGTKGKWEVEMFNGILDVIDIFVDKNTDESDVICQVYSLQETNYKTPFNDEMIANAELIADAGNTIQKCGYLPSELLEQRDELLNDVKELLALLRFHGYNNSNEIYNAWETIGKINQQ